MALLASITLDLGHRHAVHPDRRQRLAHLIELEGFYDRDDEFHGRLSLGGDRRFTMPNLSAMRAKNKRNLLLRPQPSADFCSVSRTRCGILHAAAQSRDPTTRAVPERGPRLCSAPGREETARCAA